MSADKVIEAANKVIGDIMAKRDLRDEELIIGVMNKGYFSFKQMKRIKYAREEAIKYINDNSCIGGYSWSYYAYGTLYDAKRLLKLAQHGDPVTLNQEDIAVLF